MSRAGYACLIALLLAGCETVGPHAPSVAPPPPPPPAPMELGSITGFGAFHTASGAHASCAGQSVALMVETPSSRARMVALYGASNHAMEPISVVKSRSAKLGPANDNSLVNSTQCATDGRFDFSGLRPGGYFLIARVRLEPPHNGQDEYVVMYEVQLRVGETQQVRLTP